MMPDILKQVGPQQYQFLKQQIGAGVEGKAAADDDDDDDVPELSVPSRMLINELFNSPLK